MAELPTPEPKENFSELGHLFLDGLRAAMVTDRQGLEELFLGPCMALGWSFPGGALDSLSEFILDQERQLAKLEAAVDQLAARIEQLERAARR